MIVLQLAANRWWTGSADPVIRLVQGLSARGHRVLLGLIAGDRFEAKAREAGIELVTDLSLETRGAPWRVLGDLARLRRLVRAEGVQVIHAHQSHDHWLGAAARGAAALVRTFHSARAVRRGALARALYARTDAALAVSREVARRCGEAGLAPTAVFRVDGVIETARFATAGGGEALRRELGLGQGPVVGSVSRLAHGRGHEALILGFERLLGDYPQARLVLAGKGEARPELEALIRQRGLTRQVTLAGYRDGDLPAVLDALDAFVLMRPGSDESCRAALEAMAAGRPVVAGRGGALPDAVSHGETGLLLDGEDPESVAGAIRTLLADPGRARRMGEAARRHALAAFAPERHAREVEAIYREILARRRA